MAMKVGILKKSLELSVYFSCHTRLESYVFKENLFGQPVINNLKDFYH